MVHSRPRWASTLAASLAIACAVAAHAASATGRGGWSPGSVELTGSAVDVAAGTTAEVPAAFPVGQAVAVNVVGAALSSSPAEVTVVLHRDGRGSRFSGSYGPITAADARGTLVGWTLSVSPTGPLPSGTITIRPGSPVIVSGNPWEVRAPNATRLGPSSATVMVAAPGGGGGTFSDSGTIDLQSQSVAGDSVTLDLAVAAR